MTHVTLFKIQKLFLTFLTVLVPPGSCMDNYSFSFFFIKQFQSIFHRIKSICIVVWVCFQNKLRLSIFLLKILFSFISLLCSFFEYRIVCALILYFNQSQMPRLPDNSSRPSANQIGIFSVISLT